MQLLYILFCVFYGNYYVYLYVYMVMRNYIYVFIPMREFLYVVNLFIPVMLFDG